jgi:hypothetical protein
VVSGFAGSLFAGSALSAALVAGPASAGQFGTAFLGLAAAAVPLGVCATVVRARWRPAPDASPVAAAAHPSTGGPDDRT